MKRTLFTLAFLIIFTSTGAVLRADEKSFFIKASAGGSYPVLTNLSGELGLQGDETLRTGYSLAFSFGKSFLDKRWEAEACFSLSRHPSFRYYNDFEDFSANLGYYGFFMIVKRCLRPESETLVPYVGAGIGYGIATLASGAAKLDGISVLAIAQIEQRIKDNISLLAEGLWSVFPLEERYSSPFLEHSNNDVIFDSREHPLYDAFNSLEFRVGIRIWLKPPSGY